MPLDYTDPVTIRYLTERNAYDNIESVRWFLKHKDEQIRRATFTEKHKHNTEEHIRKQHMESDMPMLMKQYEVNGLNRRKKPQLGETSLSPFVKPEVPQDLIMKPVDTDESTILYEPLVSGGGRRAYLNKRKRKLPEEKYISCATSNVYGWGLQDREGVYRVSKFKRYSYFVHDLQRKSGVHPDPAHYEPPTEVIYKKCIGFE